MKPRTPSAIISLLTVIAGIAYNSWLLGFLNPGLDPVNGYLSELSATDQPYHLIFVGGDSITGVLTIVVAAMALRAGSRRGGARPAPAGGWAVAGWAAVLAFGVFALGDAVFPMDCAPSLDPDCELRKRLGQVSFAHRVHTATSIGVVVSGIAGVGALTIAARRNGRWPIIARWGPLFLITAVITSLGTLMAILSGTGIGLVQRAHVVSISLWLITVAVALYADRSRAEPEPSPREHLAAQSSI